MTYLDRVRQLDRHPFSFLSFLLQGKPCLFVYKNCLLLATLFHAHILPLIAPSKNVCLVLPGKKSFLTRCWHTDCGHSGRFRRSRLACVTSRRKFSFHYFVLSRSYSLLMHTR